MPDNNLGTSHVSVTQNHGAFFGESPRNTALRELGEHGLTAEHLRAYEGESFEFIHGDALRYLICERGERPEEAVRQMCHLDVREAGTMAGLLPYQTSALLELRCRGLTAEMLRSCSNQTFEREQFTELKRLLDQERLPLEDAFGQVSGGQPRSNRL
jgi:hypothetical protein